MKYTFKSVSLKENDKYALKTGTFRQTSIWKKLKWLFKYNCINGYDKNGNIVLSCLILKFGFVFYISYSPRGFLCDYSNKELIKEFTEYYKKFMKKHHILYTIFDPEIIRRNKFVEVVENKSIHECFKDLGYINNLKLNGQMQVNNNYRVILDDTYENIFSKFDKKLQYNINLCEKRGVTIEKYVGKEIFSKKEVFDRFFEVFIETSERKHFTIKNRSFYEKLAMYLGDYCTVYLAKYNYDVDYDSTRELISTTEKEIEGLENATSKKENSRLKELNKNLESYKQRLENIKEYKDTNPYIGGAYFICTGDESHYLLGANSNRLRFTKPTSLLLAHMIKDSVNKKCKVFNLGGSLAYTTDKLEDDPLYSVYSFKEQLNGELVDYYGDYYLVNNKKAYLFLEGKYKLMRRLNNKF